ncbi:CLUMA_CG016986, isoform A [Clunio marinus]|uniref:CLUMA_CG016986, isoform A n=1 Tax=Clunio marinus TaxID=568069 RepID=A0A1J1IUS3_9DIPT|nr:CLUMA_CG016986, isoform A [Clunio marinus]
MNKTIGILRKSNYQQHHEPSPNLLVFGYQSKLYRDDKKALEFDREVHLIPAPYERKDLISRYDVRATLDSAPQEAHDSFMNRLDYLSPAEQQAEMMAEKERYYSLYTNEVEEELYKEELKKREAQSGYNQVSFSYNKIGPVVEKEATVSQEPDDNDTTPFTPSAKLDLPVDMETPPTVKLNQIIEKTAKFISSQGPQMEILLKTKQSSNPQFEFLNHNGQYNSYYKHILAMIKANTYPWEEAENEDKNEETNSQEPSNGVNNNTNGKEEIAATQPTISSIIIPKMIFKPSADCAYTQLISKITKAPIAEIEKQKQQESEMKQKINGVTTTHNEVLKKSSGLLGLVHYSSDSESEDENVMTYSGLIPPSDLQLVIDKTAIYVGKNGVEFEETLRKKQDVRFQFLDVTNEFHQYYVFKVNESRGLPQPIATTSSVVVKKSDEEIKQSKPTPAPVCFSIKSKEEKTTTLKPTILQTNSSDEETKNENVVHQDPSKLTSVEEELEMQVDAMNAEREEKLAKDKLTEKLMNAAREKLGMLPKEKMLQIERKKKALMFINQIKGSNGSSSNGATKDDNDVINLTHCGDDSDDSVKSIPVNTVPSSLKHSSRSPRSRKRSTSHSTRSSNSSSSSSHSRSSSRSHKKSKSKKSHRSKKKYRRKSRSKSRSHSSSRKKSRRERRH